MVDKETQNTIFDPKKLTGKIEYNTSEVECPELNELMGVTKGNVIVKVRQATLNEFLRAQKGESVEQVMELATKLQYAAVGKSPEQIADNVSDIFGFGGELLPQTLMQISICESCIIEPKLSRSDIVKISKFYPYVIPKIANVILNLTQVGAGGIKKNSQS